MVDRTLDAVVTDGVAGMQYAVLVARDADGKARVVAVDNNGSVGAGGGGGAGTEYTEDAAAAANPVGPALILVRRDTLTAAEVTADGDNVAGKATSKGELYTKDTDLAAAMTTALSPGKAASASVTPAAASHVANDVVGGAMTFALGTVSGCTFLITGATFEIDTATAQVSTWTLHLYDVTPPSATADDGAWDLPSGDRASYLGSISLGTALDLGSTQWIEVNNVNKAVKLSGTGLFGYLVNGTTLTTAAVVHKVTLIGTPL